MAKFQCSDCPRMVVRCSPSHKRCEKCSKKHALENRRQYARDHKDWHAGYQTCLMRVKRQDPDFVDNEREALRNRMRRLRLKRLKAGLNNRGEPFKHQVWAVKAKERQAERV